MLLVDVIWVHDYFITWNCQNYYKYIILCCINNIKMQLSDINLYNFYFFYKMVALFHEAWIK